MALKFKQFRDYPDYRAAADRLDQLALELDQTETRRDDLLGRLNEAFTASDATGEIYRQAAQLVIGAEAAPTANPGASPRALEAQANELREKVKVLTEAVRIQREVIGRLAGRYSAVISEQLLPEHQARVLKVAGRMDAADFLRLIRGKDFAGFIADVADELRHHE